MTDDDDDFAVCEGCGKVIRTGDLCHRGSEVYLCAECAPSFEDLAKSPEYFKGPEDDEVSADEANRIVEDYLATGGRLTDKMVAAY